MRRVFADQALGKAVVEGTLQPGEELVASEIVLPSFAASANVCFRAITFAAAGDAVAVDIVRIAAVRLYEQPDGSYVWARTEWTSEQTSLLQATTGRCACECACQKCVPVGGGWVVRLEHAPVQAPVGDAVTLKYTLEYKATISAPCCELLRRCGEEEVEPVPYGAAPVLVRVLS